MRTDRDEIKRHFKEKNPRFGDQLDLIGQSPKLTEISNLGKQ